MLGLYLHIPFCQAICSYCNFNRGLLDADLKTRYVAALEREIALCGAASSTRQAADTIFFGGGTPSLLSENEISRLIQACAGAYDVAADAEITLEANPETATRESLTAWRRAGVNRVSFGVQSFDDDELKRLGRIHSADRAERAIRDARAAGFTNLSFDLMCWLPGQTVSSFLRTVDRAVSLEPDHLSMYLLELYPNAPLKEDMARSGWSQAPDEDAAEMYLAALERFDRAGLAQYEISNVARPGYFSRHNVKYWQMGQWLGFGCGAHSTAHGRRWRNLASTTDYILRLVTSDGSAQSVRLDDRELPASEQIEEALFTGLRLTAGIDVGTFQDRFGVNPWNRYGEALAPYVGDGMMWEKDGRFGLTRRGMLVANEILATFV